MLTTSQYRKFIESLSALYPQLLNTSLVSADRRFAQKNHGVKYDQYLAVP